MLLPVKVGAQFTTPLDHYMLQKFYNKNKEISRRLSDYLPQAKNDPFDDYEQIIIEIIKRMENPLILDVGGGKQCLLASSNRSEKKVICLDIQFDQLLENYEADYLVMGDAAEIPLANHSVDMVISRSFIEHISSIEPFYKESYRVLKRGGYFINVLSCKFALFAIINQMLPNYLSKKLLNHFAPESEEDIGFKAYYHGCYFTGIKNHVKNNNFKIIDIKPYYFSSLYFDFFVPFFLLYSLYEMCIQSIRNLSAFLLMVAQKEV